MLLYHDPALHRPIWLMSVHLATASCFVLYLVYDFPNSTMAWQHVSYVHIGVRVQTPG